ncbi:diguanylate cyclase [Colwellia sp. C2M11]|nr:diguanylate cyclase [Colwellia sp. C2M11]
MLNRINNSHNYYIVFAKCLIFILFIFLNNKLLAKTSPIESAVQSIDYKTAKSFINNLRANKLDYLKNEKEFQTIFEMSKNKSWDDIHLEAAVLYSELLFRQEQYETLNHHINAYIENEGIKKQRDLYLLLLEAKLKYLSRHEDPTAAKALAKQLEEQVLLSNDKEKVIIFRALSYYYTSVDKLKKTLEVSVKGLELAITYDDFSSQGFFLRKISDAYNFSDENDKALSFSKQAIIAYEKTNDEHLTSKAYWSMGTILQDRGDNEGALVYLKKALQYFKSVNMHTGIAFSQYIISRIEFSEGHYDEALRDIYDNIALARAAGVHDMHLASMILVSDIYIAQGLIEKANEINDEVFALLDKFSRSIYKSNFLSKRYKLKRQLGLDEEAFDAIEQELIFTKKHLEATSENNIRTLQVKFEVKEKEAEILRLAQVNAMSEFKAKEEYQQKIIWRLSTVIAVILILVSLFLINRQVSQRKKYHTIANTDYLTSCPNRRGIMVMAENSLFDNELTIAIVDLDYFKKINDTLGHDVGDLVLIAFANAARKTLRDHDKFGRYGGEEWLFILHTTKKSVVDNIFKRLNENFANYCIDIKSEHPALDWDITFSVGASITSKTNNNLDFYIKNADALLYQAKADGRNQVVIG